MNIKSIALVTLILVCFSVSAQKIKYKDLYPKLAAKNYEEGGPQLKQFLSDPKNAEEANANLQMGLWLEDRFLKYDVVNDSSRMYEVGDSTVFYLEKAKSLITEKELKKNDEYYQAFFRRDLRTGKFGIKVSDVHLDIEKKIEAIEGRIDGVKQMHGTVVMVEESHASAMKTYKELVGQFDVYNHLLIGADANVQELLNQIESDGKQAVENAGKVQDLAKKMGSEKYSQDLELKTITNYGTDGMEVSELRSGSISIWNFEEWARDTKSQIIGGIALFKTMVKSYGDEIRSIKKQVKKSQNVDIPDLPDELTSQFSKYDPESTAEKLLKVEMYEAKINKQVDLQINRDLLDSSLIGPQLAIYEIALADAKAMNLIVESITNDDLEIAKKKYTDYIDGFFQEYVTASKYVGDMKTWSRRQVGWLENSVDYWTEANRWGTDAENEEIKYPLFEQDSPESGFMTMKVPVNTPDEVIAYGANLNDKKGYVSAFGPDRISKWIVNFDLPGTEAIQYESDSIPTIKGSESFYIYNASAAENNFVVVSYTSTGKLNWGTVVTVSKKPVDFKFDDLTQELTILLYPEEDLPLDSDELGYVVIDRTGNAR